jgi:Mrp family chromosome partitioning ATPase
VSKYYDAMTRKQLTRPRERSVLQTSVLLDYAARSTSLISLPTLEQGPAAIARAGDLRSLSERLAPLAAVERSTRVLISGCRRGDGTSTVSAAIAIDLSQRLGLRTLLIDAHLRHPSLHHMLVSHRRSALELVLDGSLQSRSTDWPRLGLLTCCPDEDEEQRQMLGQLEGLLSDYPAIVVDLGVPRLDARMLPLARPQDPILMVVRQGQTERRELATSADALRAANRTLAGVVLNATTDPVAKPIRRFLSKWISY